MNERESETDISGQEGRKRHGHLHQGKMGKHEERHDDKLNRWLIVALVVAVVFVLFNQYQMYSLKSIARGSGSAAASSGEASLDSAIGLVISRGVPSVYGEELGVSFDDVEGSLAILRELDPSLGRKPVRLEGNEQIDRYVKIGSMIACEYCCGVPTLVQKDGRPACGCAHSYAMRGLAAYLLKEHGSELTDDQILRELARWKAMFFPKQMITKFMQEAQSGQFTPDIAALLLDVKDTAALNGIKSIPVPSSLPNMVGGC